MGPPADKGPVYGHLLGFHYTRIPVSWAYLVIVLVIFLTQTEKRKKEFVWGGFAAPHKFIFLPTVRQGSLLQLSLPVRTRVEATPCQSDSRMCITVHLPATTSNLGPGFDVLGLALDLWNTVTVEPSEGWKVTITGEGEGQLPQDTRNRVAQAFRWTFQQVGAAPPEGVHIHCHNRVPVGSGLGSSATAVLAGMAAALGWMGHPLDRDRLLAWAVQWEGHPDNAAPALYGGLVAAGLNQEGRPWVLALDVHPFWIQQAWLVLALPQVNLPTQEARRVLPRRVPLEDAVFNLAHALKVVEALRRGDPDLLREGMTDRWHQPYRLPLIPGASEAMQAAQEAGAVAVMLSGAGPSVLAWVVGDPGPVEAAMADAFRAYVPVRTWRLRMSPQGLWVQE